MRGPTHALGGAVAAAAFFLYIPFPHHFSPLALAAVGGFAALLPDMDNSESTIENITIAGFQPFNAPAWVIDKLFKHRGFLHSLLAVLLLIFLLLGFLARIPTEISVAIIVGYFSHLVLDALTPAGIPWFYPVENNFTLIPKILCITTGSFTEKIFFIVLVGVGAILLSKAGYIILPTG